MALYLARIIDGPKALIQAQPEHENLKGRAWTKQAWALLGLRPARFINTIGDSGSHCGLDGYCLIPYCLIISYYELIIHSIKH